jgi:hypothetical protein
MYKFEVLNFKGQEQEFCSRSVLLDCVLYNDRKFILLHRKIKIEICIRFLKFNEIWFFHDVIGFMKLLFGAKNIFLTSQGYGLQYTIGKINVHSILTKDI